MPIALVPYIGSGTIADPFRPDMLDRGPAIDLRADPTQRTGWALVSTAVVPVSGLTLGVTLDTAMTAKTKNDAGAALGVAVSASTPRALLPELLITHATPTGPRWKPLAMHRRADGLLVRQIWLGELAWEQVIEGGPGAMLSESFNKVDATTLGPDLVWTEALGDWKVATNAAEAAAAGTNLAVASADLATGDQRAGVDLVTIVNKAGTAVRADSGGSNCYNGIMDSAGSWLLYKLVAGTWTHLGSVAGAVPALPVHLEVKVEGSSVSLLQGSTVKVGPITDTALGATLRKVGILADGVGDRVDNFVGQDIAAASQTVTRSPSTNAVITTGWTNPQNAYSDDNVYATASPGKSLNVITEYAGFDFGSVIPDGSTIESVMVRQRWFVSTTGSIATLGSQAYVGTTAQGTEFTNVVEPLTEALESYSVTGLTRANLLDLRVRIRANRGNTNTAFTASLDAVDVVVGYTAPAASPISVAIGSLPLALTSQAVAPTASPPSASATSLAVAMATQALVVTAPAAPTLSPLALALTPQGLDITVSSSGATLASLALVFAPEPLGASAGAAPIEAALASLSIALVGQVLASAPASAAPIVGSLPLVVAAHAVASAPAAASTGAPTLVVALALPSLVASAPAAVSVASLALALAPQSFGSAASSSSVAIKSLALAVVPSTLATAPMDAAVSLVPLAFLLGPQLLEGSAGAVAPVVALATLTLGLMGQSMAPAAAPAAVALPPLAFAMASSALVSSSAAPGVALASLALMMAAQLLVGANAVVLPAPAGATVLLAQPRASVDLVRSTASTDRPNDPNATTTVAAPSARVSGGGS